MSNSNQAKDAAVPNANAVKGQGSHILAVAVGAGLNSQSSLNRIIAVSGPDVFSGAGTFDISTRRRLSRGGLRRPGGGAARGRVPAVRAVGHGAQARRPHARPWHGRPRSRRADWDLTTTASPVPAKWVLPANGAGSTATVATDANGFATFQWTTAAPTSSQVSVTEENPALVPPGFVNDPSATSCVVRTPDTAGDRPLPVTTTPNGFRATVTHESIATCTMVNRVPPAPAIDDREGDQRQRRRRAAGTVRPDRRPGRVDVPGDQHRQRHALETSW